MVKDETQLMYQLQYTPDQANIVRYARMGHMEIGNIDDLDPSVYNARFMRVVACGRGTNTTYGNIDDLDPTRYTASHAIWVSRGRGDKQHANIDDLDPAEHDPSSFELISRHRFNQWLKSELDK